MLWRREKSLPPARNRILAVQPVTQIYENDIPIKISFLNKLRAD
jgi:hypothetical protein